jgi:histidinol dehydrogenase
MNILRYPDKKEWSALLDRPELNHQILEEQVQLIIQDVASKGDNAVRSYTREFDKYDGEVLEVSQEEIRSSKEEVSPELRKAIEEAMWNI